MILNTPETSGLSVGTPIPLSLGSVPERPTYETAYSDLLLQTRSAFDVSPYTLNVAPKFSQFLETSTIADTTDMWTLARAANGEAVILGFDKGRVIVHGLETEDFIARSTRDRHIHEFELVSLFAAEMRFQLRYYPDKLASVLEDTLGSSCAFDKTAYKAFDCNGGNTSIPAMEFNTNSTTATAVSYTHLTLPTNREV